MCTNRKTLTEGYRKAVRLAGQSAARLQMAHAARALSGGALSRAATSGGIAPASRSASRASGEVCARCCMHHATTCRHMRTGGENDTVHPCAMLWSAMPCFSAMLFC